MVGERVNKSFLDFFFPTLDTCNSLLRDIVMFAGGLPNLLWLVPELIRLSIISLACDPILVHMPLLLYRCNTQYSKYVLKRSHAGEDLITFLCLTITLKPCLQFCLLGTRRWKTFFFLKESNFIASNSLLILKTWSILQPNPTCVAFVCI